jgi:Rieske Fe-S protein
MSGVRHWEDDFPISWVDDHFVTRREFTKSLVWVSGSTFVGAGTLAALQAAGAGRAARALEPKRVASVADVAVGGVRIFEYPTAADPCLLIRLEPDRFVAFGQKCTHLGCPVLYRAPERCLYCPCHEGYFDAADGRVLSGPPPRPLPRIRLERRGDELWATGVES